MDAFIQELIYQVADFNLVVVNQLTLDDQLYINNLHQHVLKKTPSGRPAKDHFILVHNFKDLDTEDQVKNAIGHDIEGIFEATRVVIPGNMVLYSSRYY